MDQISRLSPFEFKDRLLEIARSHADRMMLNAGRGNPNFLAVAPRRAFLQLGEFALQEAERSYSYLSSGYGGLPENRGMLHRFETWMQNHEDAEGMRFIRASLALVNDQLGLKPEEFLCEMVTASLGCQYPEPVAILKQFEPVLAAYIRQELFGGLHPVANDFRLFATEGGTAAMSYLFQSLRANHLLKAGDTIALGTPIFTPYLEIPELADYQLKVIEIEAEAESGWQLTDKALQELENPAIKLFCLVNPSNPPSVKMNSSVASRLVNLANDKRPDLMIITDDVYGTFTDDFRSLFALCPRNTFCVYSFSKYFGATGWRIGLIGLHDDNVFDQGIRQLPDKLRAETCQRYRSISAEPEKLPMIERLVADSRTVALHHSAGLSTPQQLQMTLFALGCLIDQDNRYKTEAKRLIRSRYRTLYRSMGIPVPEIEGLAGYYTLLDLRQLASELYGPEFASWFLQRHGCQDFLLRLADKTSIVLLPAKGFEVHYPAVRVSLANLCLADYAAIGRFTRQVLNEYFQEYSASR